VNNRVKAAAQYSLMIALILVAIAECVAIRNTLARPAVSFVSIESHCHDSWPDQNAVARVLQSLDGLPKGARLGEWSGLIWSQPSYGVVATFEPIPVSLPGKFGPVTIGYANAVIITDSRYGRDGMIDLRIMLPGTPRKFRKVWSNYRWWEFFSSDTESVCKWLPY
jgi:hypothetical protein